MPQITSKDVARLAGVSQSTVSLVLNHVTTVQIAAKTREKVLQAARELNYQPNVLAQSLKTNRSKIIGLLLPSITNPFFPSIAQGIEDFAVASGYNVFLCNTFRDQVKEENYVKTLISKQVDGIIFASSVENPLIFREAQKRKIPIVTFDRRIENNDFDCLQVDNIQGGEMAVNYLFSLGHRNIGFITTYMGTSGHIDRLTGYKNAYEKAGIAVNPNYIKDDRYQNKGMEDANDYEMNIGRKLAADLLKQCPEVTAIFAVNDLIALGIIGLRQQGIRIPEDLSVIGFDNINLAKIASPALTTIAQPTYQMGQQATKLLIAKITRDERDCKAPRQLLLFPPELIVRDSCAPNVK
jgi:DNA-binding LacI/PurR family transcriptional regulator